MRSWSKSSSAVIVPTGMSMPRKASGLARTFIELPEAPCFRPTAAEWADPLQYIAAIRQHAEPYGLCRIVPPAGWAPPFAIEKETLQFRTLVQRVHELQERADDPGARSSFNCSFAAWQAATGALQRKAPSLGSQEVDLCSLYRAVSRRGGYDAVTDAKAWRDVARMLGVSFVPSERATLARPASCRTLISVLEAFEAAAACMPPLLRVCWAMHCLLPRAFPLHCRSRTTAVQLMPCGTSTRSTCTSSSSTTLRGTLAERGRCLRGVPCCVTASTCRTSWVTPRQRKFLGPCWSPTPSGGPHPAAEQPAMSSSRQRSAVGCSRRVVSAHADAGSYNRHA